MCTPSNRDTYAHFLQFVLQDAYLKSISFLFVNLKFLLTQPHFVRDALLLPFFLMGTGTQSLVKQVPIA